MPVAQQPVVLFPAPDVGDIVWCQFPRHPSLYPEPKKRPALVLSVNKRLVPVRVRVVFGTSKWTQEVDKGWMVIHQKDAKAFASAGLSYTTRINLKQAAWLPYTSMWFDLAPLVTGSTAPTPTLGQLHPSSISDLVRALREAGMFPM